MRFRAALILAVCILLPAGRSYAQARLYVTPTVGVWKWDNSLIPGYDLSSGTAFVWGGRAGYSPFQAFAGEIVFLTGTNDAEIDSRTVSLRLSQIELSMVVNFRSLIDSPVYPFLDLGGGVSLLGGGEGLGEAEPSSSHLSFHLGGGLKADLSEHVALRANVRDTFFTETQDVGTQDNQVTVDAVELSLGIELRLPVGRKSRPERLR